MAIFDSDYLQFNQNETMNKICSIYLHVYHNFVLKLHENKFQELYIYFFYYLCSPIIYLLSPEKLKTIKSGQSNQSQYKIKTWKLHFNK